MRSVGCAPWSSQYCTRSRLSDTSGLLGTGSYEPICSRKRPSRRAALLAATWPWFALRYFPRKERVESARLEALYGQAYVEYRNAVPALWPRLSRWRPESMQGESRLEPWRIEHYSDNNELGTVLAVVLGVSLIGMRTLWA